MKNLSLYKITKVTTACMAVLLCCSAFTFSLADKPGSAALAEALRLKENEKYQAASDSLHKALADAVDNETKARAFAELGKLSLKSHLTEIPPAEGIKLLQQAEALGDTGVLMSLGRAYHYGEGVQIDLAKAQGYYQKASAKHPRALYQLAVLQKGTAEGAENFRQYVAWVEAQPNISSELMLKIARYYRQAEVTPVDMVRSEQWYRKANQADNEVAKLELAKLWEDNNHQPFSDVINLLKEAAESGSADAMQKLGFIYLDGQKVPQNIELADRYLRRASTTNPALTFKVARQYEILAKQNKALVPQALDWMGDAAKQGNADALARLGRYARKGEWVKKDVNVARKFYQTAIKAGHEGARTELAKLEARDAQIRQKKALQRQEHEQKLAEARAQKKAQHDTGKQNTRASKDAAKMAAMKRKQFAELSEDAEKGDIAAMREVGRCYMQGKGVERDTDKGLAWLNKAAGVRDLEAMVDLASAYASGSGAAYDIVKAYEWYAKAAEAGSPIAQYQLGLGYARGIGVSENKALAKQWLEKARNNGYAPAASALETLDVNSAGNKQ